MAILVFISGVMNREENWPEQAVRAVGHTFVSGLPFFDGSGFAFPLRCSRQDGMSVCQAHSNAGDERSLPPKRKIDNEQREGQTRGVNLAACVPFSPVLQSRRRCMVRAPRPSYEAAA
jgi:hypothetical protein